MLNSTRDEKVEKKSDRAGSREQFKPSLGSVRGFWSQVLLGRGAYVGGGDALLGGGTIIRGRRVVSFGKRAAPEQQ